MTTTLIISDDKGGVAESRTYCCDQHAQTDPDYAYAWKQVEAGFGCQNDKARLIARSYQLGGI